MNIHSKLPRTGTTIFTVMSALAQQHNAVNLGQGFPDFLCDEELMKLASKYIHEGYNQYAPMPGLPRLRQVLADKYNTLYNTDIDWDKDITITAGGTQAIYSAITAIAQEDDEIIIFEPAYDSYVPAIELCKAVPVYITLTAPDFKIDWEQVKKSITHKTKAIILNTPHNPTGRIWTAQDMQMLDKLTQGTDIIIISDEVYEHLVFDNKTHESVLKYPTLRARSYAAYSFGKTYHNTGWKMGYVIAPEHLTKELRKVHQFIVFSVNTPFQYAFADMVSHADTYKGLNSFYQHKRDLFLNLIKGTGWKPLVTQGSYFQLLDYSAFSSKHDTDFAVELVERGGIAAVPLSVFYHHAPEQKLLRFCFAKKDETLEAAAEKLRAFKG